MCAPELVVYEHVAVEQKAPVEASSVQHVGEPQAIVLPHTVIGNPIEGSPPGCGLLRFGGITFERRGGEDVAVDRQTVEKLEPQLSAN